MPQSWVSRFIIVEFLPSCAYNTMIKGVELGLSGVHDLVYCHHHHHIKIKLGCPLPKLTLIFTKQIKVFFKKIWLQQQQGFESTLRWERQGETGRNWGVKTERWRMKRTRVRETCAEIQRVAVSESISSTGSFKFVCVWVVVDFPPKLWARRPLESDLPVWAVPAIRWPLKCPLFFFFFFFNRD